MHADAQPQLPNISTIQLPLKSPDFGGFRCEPPGEQDEIGDYLIGGDALRDQRAGVSRTYLVFDTDHNVLVAYYTLLADAIQLGDKERESTGTYQTAPAIKIARLGVSFLMQGRGLGKALVSEILREFVYPISLHIGVRFVGQVRNRVYFAPG